MSDQPAARPDPTHVLARPRTRTSATLKDVAELSGVSIKTASRVLNEEAHVAPATRTAVLAAIRELGYVPDPAARSLRAGHDRTVGIVVDSIGDPFFASLVARAEEVLGDGGYRAFICSSNRDLSREVESIRDLVQRRCAGIIVAPTARNSLADVHLGGTPVVFVDRIGDVPGAVSVVADDHGLSRLATAHLIAHGHTRIAILSDLPVVETTLLRHDGYRAAMRAASIVVDEALVRADIPAPSAVVELLRALLALPDPPTALLCANSRIVLGAVPALHQFGRTDVAVISYGDFATADSLSPAVTVIDHAPEAIGEVAARAMLSLLAGVAPDEPVTVVPADLVPRGSGELRPRQESSERRP